jgi:hypothetical protein
MQDQKYDKTFEDRGLYVAEQDRYVLEPMHPALTPRANANEFLVPADKAIARYREYCQDWEDRGWRIDVNQVREDQDRIAYAIPSPGRRESKGWVLPAVPRFAGKADAKAAAG